MAVGGGQIQDLIDVIVVAVVVSGSKGGFGVRLTVAQRIKFGQVQKFGRIFPVSKENFKSVTIMKYFLNAQIYQHFFGLKFGYFLVKQL